MRRATKRPSAVVGGEREDFFVDRKRMNVDGPNARYGGGGGAADYRGTKVGAERIGVAGGAYDNRSRVERFERPSGAPPVGGAGGGGAGVTRRVVEEMDVGSRRDNRPPPPHTPPRERDDRRVIERGREDRY